MAVALVDDDGAPNAIDDDVFDDDVGGLKLKVVRKALDS